jgi:hypothetical protein
VFVGVGVLVLVGEAVAVAVLDGVTLLVTDGVGVLLLVAVLVLVGVGVNDIDTLIEGVGVGGTSALSITNGILSCPCGSHLEGHLNSIS